MRRRFEPALHGRCSAGTALTPAGTEDIVEFIQLIYDARHDRALCTGLAAPWRGRQNRRSRQIGHQPPRSENVYDDDLRLKRRGCFKTI